MQMSHRSDEFRVISERAKACLRSMLSIPDNFEILFTQGGAQMQFSALCYNLIGKYKTANYLNTGAWGRAAAEEAKKFC